MTNEPTLKQKTARTLKWNTIDRVGSQVLYAVVGVVLANVLSKEDFGLVGALLVFQAFANLFVDSGFGAALLQRKEPTQRDYSTVFWFNMAVSVAVYVVLFFSAPLIADIFQGDRRLIPLSKVMFLAFVLNGLGMVQTTRLMKTMNVRMIAVANMLALVVSGALGIGLALSGFGAWALVWQTVTLSAVKSAWLWITGHWRPLFGFWTDSLRRMWRVGLSVFSTSALNTFFLYIYSFVIGAFYNLASLGVYTQADKWSKMGSASMSQILTASFVPLLARFQDESERFVAMVRKVNRFTAFILFPFMGGLLVMAEPIFHLLFGQKWDAAIPLFQILVFRGIFVVLVSLYNNYVLALGRPRALVRIEIIKDALTIAAIFVTLPFGTVEALVWGQLAASAATYVIVLAIVCRHTGCPAASMVYDLLPYLGLTTACMACMATTPLYLSRPALMIIVEAAIGVALYAVVLRATGSVIMKEAAGYLFGRFRRK